MSSSLALRRQIRSISSTRKITRAMEMVAVSKMRKSVASALGTRSFAKHALAFLRYLSLHKELGTAHPLLTQREKKSVAFLLITTNKGLCGGFNNALISTALTLAKKERHNGVKDVSFITWGKKGREAVARLGYRVRADFPKKDSHPSLRDVLPVVRFCTDEMISGKVDCITRLSMNYISSMYQQPKAHVFLPLLTDIESFSRLAHDLGMDNGNGGSSVNGYELSRYVFEPSEEGVLSSIIPRVLEMHLFHALLESEASEHSARMMAMHNASQAAGDLVDDLQLTFNQLRQGAITREIAEISAASSAVTSH